ncbi:hypothetical protein NQZ68_037012 [Dissostichus eleginoides]|nr:hypothetical protein NQZ68_037012 [Dissostichus eleginoides]
MWMYGYWASVLGAIMENSECDLSDSRKEGVKHEPAGLHGLRYANWRLAGAERGSAELRGTLAQSPHSLLPSLKLPLRLPWPSSSLQLSAPHASHRQAW